MTVMEQSGPAAADVAARIDDIVSRWDRGDSPGVALGVVRGGELVLQRYAGMANLELGVPLGPASLFDIASTSKQFTAAMILLLADQGLVGLDDPVQAYVPELPEYDEPITVRHLVHHTSGIRDYIAVRMIAGFDDRDYFDMQDVIDHVAAQRGLNFPPGTKHMYSNSGYVLMAVVVQRVTGMSFQAACRQRLFSPLGMESSAFREDSSLVHPGMVQMYHLDEKDVLRKVTVNDDVVGDGALQTTLPDLARWAANYSRGTVGGPDFLARMSASGTPEDDETRYGFGLMCGEYRGVRTVHHGGNLQGFNGQFLCVPEHDLAVICLANHGGIDSSAIVNRVVDVYLEDVLAPEGEAGGGDARGAALVAQATALDAVAASDLAGQYRDAESGLVLDVVADQAGAPVIKLAEYSLPLAHRTGRIYSGRFQEIDFEAAFVPDEQGNTGLHLVHEGEVLMGGTRIQAMDAAGLDLAEYAGDYRSDEAPLPCRIVLDGDTLVLQRGRAKPDRLRATLPDELATRFGTLRFQRDAAGRVSGFTATMSRSGGVLYERVPG